MRVSLFAFFIITSTLLSPIKGSISVPMLKEDVEYTDKYAVYVRLDVDLREMLNMYDLIVINLGNLVDDLNVFEVGTKDQNVVEFLNNSRDVIKVERQLKTRCSAKGISVRAKREFDQETRFNDPLLNISWHLYPKGMLSMGVAEAWSKGYSGRGVNVMHLDNGIEYTHSELNYNFRRFMAFDIVDNDNDPFPADKDEHGTSMAGLVAARADNNKCSVGLAFNANLGMVRMFASLEFDITDTLVARALEKCVGHADIVVRGFGPKDDGAMAQRLGVLETAALHRLVHQSRGGLGAILVYPAGNGGSRGDSCALDMSANIPQAVTTAAVGESGQVPYYAERCSAVLAAAFSSGRRPDRFVVSVGRDNDCNKDFSGTSGAAAIMGGALALVLEANSAVNWRDMQHIIVNSAKMEGLIVNDIITNKAGRQFSHYFGFGLLDVNKAVQLARNWRPLPKALRCDVASSTLNTSVAMGETKCVVLNVDKECAVNFLEHVVLRVSVDVAKRGDVDLILRAPSNTSSLVLPSRRLDYSRADLIDWQLVTRAMWEENPKGTWSLCITHVNYDRGAFMGDLRLAMWTLELHGTNIRPQLKTQGN